jgi:hypothetical protein
MKNVTFAGHIFSQERDNKHHLKFYMMEIELLIYRVMPRVLDFDA